MRVAVATAGFTAGRSLVSFGDSIGTNRTQLESGRAEDTPDGFDRNGHGLAPGQHRVDGPLISMSGVAPPVSGDCSYFQISKCPGIDIELLVIF